MAIFSIFYLVNLIPGACFGWGEKHQKIRLQDVQVSSVHLVVTGTSPVPFLPFYCQLGTVPVGVAYLSSLCDNRSFQ